MSEINTTKAPETTPAQTVDQPLDLDLEIRWREDEIRALAGEVRAYKRLKELQAKITIVVPAQSAPVNQEQPNGNS